MNRQELPAKLASATVNVVFDFTSDLASGEGLSSAVVVATVYSGIDALPSNVLVAGASIAGAIVTQRITAGTVGVLYELKCSVTTSLGQTLVKCGILAVVPDL